MNRINSEREYQESSEYLVSSEMLLIRVYQESIMLVWVRKTAVMRSKRRSVDRFRI